MSVLTVSENTITTSASVVIVGSPTDGHVGSCGNIKGFGFYWAQFSYILVCPLRGTKSGP